MHSILHTPRAKRPFPLFPHPRIPSLRHRLALGMLLSSCLAAGAQTAAIVQLQYAPPQANGGAFGAILATAPAYSGSDEKTQLALPLLSYQWANGWFAGVDNGLGYNFSQRPDLHYGLRLGIEPGRRESSASTLRGMGDLPAYAEAGAFATRYWGEHWVLGAGLRHGSGPQREGTVLDLALQYQAPITAQWSWSAQVQTSWANAAHLQSHFGVDPQQSARSGYRTHAPQAGLRDVQGGASLHYAWQPRTRLVLSALATQLQGDAAHSPLVRERQAHSASMVLLHGF
ncbi:MAG: MipA/OmpV family protein [Rhodoferax sp.]